jgi:hypothetical protein
MAFSEAARADAFVRAIGELNLSRNEFFFSLIKGVGIMWTDSKLCARTGSQLNVGMAT